MKVTYEMWLTRHLVHIPVLLTLSIAALNNVVMADVITTEKAPNSKLFQYGFGFFNSFKDTLSKFFADETELTTVGSEQLTTVASIQPRIAAGQQPTIVETRQSTTIASQQATRVASQQSTTATYTTATTAAEAKIRLSDEQCDAALSQCSLLEIVEKEFQDTWRRKYLKAEVQKINSNHRATLQRLKFIISSLIDEAIADPSEASLRKVCDDLNGLKPDLSGRGDVTSKPNKPSTTKKAKPSTKKPGKTTPKQTTTANTSSSVTSTAGLLTTINATNTSVSASTSQAQTPLSPSGISVKQVQDASSNNATSPTSPSIPSRITTTVLKDVSTLTSSPSSPVITKTLSNDLPGIPPETIITTTPSRIITTIVKDKSNTSLTSVKSDVPLESTPPLKDASSTPSPAPKSDVPSEIAATLLKDTLGNLGASPTTEAKPPSNANVQHAPPQCVVSAWSDWSAPFGFGVQERKREVLQPGVECPEANNLLEQRNLTPVTNDNGDFQFEDVEIVSQNFQEDFIQPASGKPRDLLLVIDSSGSISKDDFTAMKEGVKILIDVLCGGFGSNNTNNRLSIVQFSTSSVGVLTFGQNQSPARLKAVVDSLQLMHGYTCTGSALDLAYIAFDPKYGSRNYTVHDTLLITDGQSNCGPNLLQASLRLQQRSNVFALALGLGGDPRAASEIQSVVSNRDQHHLFSLANYRDFHVMAKSIQENHDATQCLEIETGK